MIDINALQRDLSDTLLKRWLKTLPETLEQGITKHKHGQYEQWRDALAQLPTLKSTQVILNQDTMTIIGEGNDNPEIQATLKQQLMQLAPWRKGPYSLHGVFIDTEWRSDWKWQRVAPHLQPLKNRLVLDVGCGSGYHCWRMLGEGARCVIGVDPSLLFVTQFQAVKHFAGDLPAHVLPLTLDDFPNNLNVFDTVFSMGILYHRRSPIDHLTQLRSCLRKGGELVLETLIIEGEGFEVLTPEDRYAKMSNVWFIPTQALLTTWLARCGFTNIRAVDINQTSLQEQRATEWMTSESLADFLNPNDLNFTIEGYPAPRRIVMVAENP